VKSIPFILRDHREQLWRHWADALDGEVDADYQDLLASPLGERILRTFIEDLIACSEAEDYEVPGLLKRLEERVTLESEHRVALGFKVHDMVVALHVLRRVIVDVLIDALVLDEMPSFADSLDQLKAANAFLDRLVCATMAAS
jgi:hypothetical protein